MKSVGQAMVRCLAAVALLGTFACSASPEAAVEEDEEALNLSPENIDVEIELLRDFPSRHRDALNHAGERASEVASWGLKYVKAKDGFDGVVASGHGPTGAVRFLIALDGPTRTMTMLDPGAGTDAAALRTADGAGANVESEAAKRLYDEVTLDWLQHELGRMQSQLASSVSGTGTTRTSDVTAGMSARAECAVRAAIGTLSIAVGFTPYALVGFVASASIEAVLQNYENVVSNGAGAAGTAAAAGRKLASGAGLKNALRAGGLLGAGTSVAAAVGVAVFGASEEFKTEPGDQVEKRSDGTAVIRHANGTETILCTGGIYTVLPQACAIIKSPRGEGLSTECKRLTGKG